MNIDKFNNFRDKLSFQEGLYVNEEYFNSVVLLLMIPIDGEYHFIFQKRNKNIRQGGEICCPGGRIDPEDTSVEQAVLRETKEEMGIPGERIEIIGRLNKVLTPSGLSVDAFVGITDVELKDITVNPEEVESFFTVPLSYFLEKEPEKYSAQVSISPGYIDHETGEEIILFPAEQLGISEKYSKPWGEFRYGIYVYPTEYGPIWGITAKIVLDFINQIRKYMKE